MSDTTGNGRLARRPLGTTGMEVTRVGFGAWAIGGAGWRFGWGSQDDDDSVAATRHAVERGIDWIDTAAVYGLGHSEEVVARALRDLPPADRPLVFTKCGLVWDENDRGAPPRRVGSPASIRREVEGSLRRLGVERIDLYQMHWPPEDGTPLEEYWGTLLELRREGKRGRWGSPTTTRTSWLRRSGWGTWTRSSPRSRPSTAAWRSASSPGAPTTTRA